MFQTIFSGQDAIRHHQEAPFSDERSAYLRALAVRGFAAKTLRRKAAFIRLFAVQMKSRPADHGFTETDLDAVLKSWAKFSPKSRKRFRSTVTGWLRWMGRIGPPPTPPPRPYDEKIDDFIKAQIEEKELAVETCKNRRKQVRLFLSFIDAQGWNLSELTPEQIDVYFHHIGQKWRRYPIKHAAVSLRAWFRHCDLRKWTRYKLADMILSPRIYRYEGLPIGPTWDEVRRVIGSAEGDDPMQLRDRAILFLLAVYALRSSELRQLTLDDIDWKRERIRIVRSKTGKTDTFPLELAVGNALARYLRHARPRCGSRALFLTIQAPFRPLSQGRLLDIVNEHFVVLGAGKKGCSPQLIRHACAQHLLDTGHSFKQVSDHLGHVNPMTTRIYAKVDLQSLRLVAMDDLGGLA